MNSVTLREEILVKLDEIREADILVGIPSYNNARTIGHVVRAVQTGFAKYFPDLKCILVNSDGGSKNNTTAIVFGGVVLALSLAFGLGGRDMAKEYLDKKLKSEEKEDEISHL